MARSVGRICKGFQRLGLLSKQTQLIPFTRVPVGTVRTIVTLPSFLFPQPRDFSLPNPSWGSEMMRMYEHYESQCEVETREDRNRKGRGGDCQATIASSNMLQVEYILVR
ncbi:Acyl-coenzyme A thioesterase THEM4 [Dissostichus eleginoides]|uniref:Acyl-coenzyme A thioesterase THEM4 n=1 Tax=Dissostichus eleginoides TaxID=100907 RepID=A0AAD9C724_DISEL|nr:Acyl-coenzyme A thioesterase THEM4 [Dissostichus eleginoides]